jgi:hypothetical protein
MHACGVATAYLKRAAMKGKTYLDRLKFIVRGLALGHLQGCDAQRPDILHDHHNHHCERPAPWPYNAGASKVDRSAYRFRIIARSVLGVSLIDDPARKKKKKKTRR